VHDSEIRSSADAVPPWGLGSGTARTVAFEVLLHGPVARAALARKLDLSPPTLSRATRELLHSDVFIEVEPRIDPDSGRPSRPLDVVADSRRFIGVRLTDSEIQAVSTTLRAVVVESSVRPLDGHDPEAVVDAVATVVEELQRDAPALSGLGVSLGGLVEDGRTVARAPFYAWRQRVDLADMLADRLGVPVALDNDVSALARYHAWFGPETRHGGFCLITLGIATGYALVLGGEVVESPDSGLGVLGHLPLDSSGPACPEGHRGCAHAMLSSESIASAVSIAAGRPLDFDAALALAADGHAGARRILSDSIAALGRLVALVTTTTMTGRVVIAGEAGGLARFDAQLLERSIADARPAGAAPVQVAVEESSFLPWARGAATAIIREYVLFDGSESRS